MQTRYRDQAPERPRLADPAPSRFTPDRWALLVIVAFALLHLYGITAPPNGYHAWRESDTAMVALNYFQHDLPFFSPQTNHLATAIDGLDLEFPIYCWLTSQGYRLFGFTHAVPHVLTLLFALLALFSFHRLIRRLTSPELALFALVAFAFSPVFFFYSYKIMPDIPMLGLGLFAMYLFTGYLDRRSWWRLLASALLLGMAAMLKPLVLGLLLPLLYLSWKAPGPPSLMHRLAIFAAYVAVVLLHPITWMLATGWLSSRTTQVGRFYDYVLTEGFFQTFIVRWTWELFVGWAMLLPFLIGVYLALHGRVNRVFPVWLLAGFIVVSLTALNSRSHDYYSLVLATSLAPFSAYGLALLWRRPRLRTLALILLVAAPVSSFARIKHRFDFSNSYHEIRAAAAQHLPPDARVIVEDPTVGAIRLYQINRYGWSLGNEQDAAKIPTYISDGADYLILETPIAESPLWLQPYLQELLVVAPDRLGPLYAYPIPRSLPSGR